MTVTLMIPQAIFTEAFLSFIGIGISAPLASLGTLAQDAKMQLEIYPMQMMKCGVRVMAGPIVRVENLEKFFKVKSASFGPKAKVRAVNQVSFEIGRGETLGLVGESGCGKSTLGRTILKVYEPDGGRILFDGTDITGFSHKEMRSFRKKMQMIFQDPYASLNPRFTVGELIGEPMEIYGMYEKQERTAKVQELMETVGLKPDHIRRYPHEFSGGQQQRIVLEGEVPSPMDIPAGCPFSARCPYAADRCKKERPELIEAEGREVACFLYQ